MINNNKINSETEFLFNRDYFDNTITEEIDEEYSDRAIKLLEDYPWDDVYNSWFEYLKNNCKTTKSVINWANLFFCYGGTDEPIKEPYKLAGYLLYKVDLKKHWSDAIDIFESIIISLLEKGGYINTLQDTDYSIEKDPNILKEVEYWRKISNQ